MRPSGLTAKQKKENAAQPGSDFKECANLPHDDRCAGRKIHNGFAGNLGGSVNLSMGLSTR
jgi:hypothetical protein